MKTVDTLVEEFAATIPFELDAFQREAIEKLDRGRGWSAEIRGVAPCRAERYASRWRAGAA